MTTQNANSDSWTLKNFKKSPPKHFIEKLILPNSENLSTIQQSHHHLQDALDVGPTFVQVCKCVRRSDISLCMSSCNRFLVHKLRFFEIFFPKKTRCLIFHIICLRTQYIQCTSAISNSQDTTTTQQQMPEAVVRRCSVTKEVLRNFAKFTGKYLYQRLVFNKVAGLVTKEVLRNFAKSIGKHLRQRLIFKKVSGTGVFL